MNQPQGSVLRVSFADNNIKDKTKLATILKHLNNLIELDLSLVLFLKIITKYDVISKKLRNGF